MDEHAFFIGTLSTPNYQFTALSRTREGVVAALEHGWGLHRGQFAESYRRSMSEWSDLADDVDVREITAGQCLRDGHPMLQART